MLLSTALMALAGCVQIGRQPLPTPAPSAIDHFTPRPQPTQTPDHGGLGNFGLQRADWQGVWSGREPDAFGYSDVQTVLMGDGTFSSQSHNAEAGTLVTVTGHWEIASLPEGPLLRFTVEDFQPKEWCGPLGCVAIQVPTGDSRYFTFVDRNTVILRQPNCDTACDVTYRR